MPITESVTKKLLLSKYQYNLAKEHLLSGNQIKYSTGIILLQDSVEIFLLAIVEQVGASIEKESRFDKYFVKIQEKLKWELPSATRLNQLNAARVNVKHHALSFSRDDGPHFLSSVIDYYDDVTEKLFSCSFQSISLVNVLNEGEEKDLLAAAEKFLVEKDYVSCLIECRKAIYLKIERWFSVELAADGNYLLALMGSKAPSYASSKEYIEKSVKNPTDFIVHDHDRLFMDLLNNGVDVKEFWNVWRLTPAVFRRKNKEWVIKHEYAKFDQEIIQANAEYVFNSAVEIILAIHKSELRVKYMQAGSYYLTLRIGAVNVYEKASRESKLAYVLTGNQKIYVDFKVNGLTDADFYFHITGCEKMPENAEHPFLFGGYVHKSDIFEPEEK